MTRVLFAKGARGGIVRKIQRRLQTLGFDPKGIDGDYGDGTRKAVIAFQKAQALPKTGEVDVATWQALTGQPVPSIRDRALQVTATFEGHDFTLAQGNFDGAGLTWGIIGFTLQHGEVSKIVLEINRRKPALVRQAFGPKTEELLRVMSGPRAQQLEWADRLSLGQSKARLAEPWRTSFAKLGECEPVQALQQQIADRDYFQPALRTAREFKLKSELGLALAFDIHVQNGGIGPRARADISSHLAQHPVANEAERRAIIAHAVADTCRPQYRQDVLSRKLTFATGAGKVHGELFVLRNWGLADVAP